MDMFSVFLQAGLGNQLFQIFTAMAYMLEHGDKLVIPEYKWDHQRRPPYWDSIFKRLKDSLDKGVKPGALRRYAEEGFHFTALKKQTSPFILFGYFQSYKYFDKHADSIIKRLNIHMEQQLIRTKYLNLRKSISLHFRIGDYMTVQLHHSLLPNEYYITAIHEIIKRTKTDDWDIIYFCEEKDNLHVKQRLRTIITHFPNISFHKASDEMADWEQLLLMSCSDHNIIANSTFSWWAAYFNTNPSKIICYPQQWFGPANADKDTKDLCPSSWIRL